MQTHMHSLTHSFATNELESANLIDKHKRTSKSNALRVKWCMTRLCVWCVHYVCVRLSQAHFQMHSELRMNVLPCFRLTFALLLFHFVSLFHSYFEHNFLLCSSAPCHLYVLFIQPFAATFWFIFYFFHCRLCAVARDERTKRNPNAMEELLKRTSNRKITITIISSDILWTVQEKISSNRIGIFSSFWVEDTLSLLFLFHWVYQRPLSVLLCFFLLCLSLGSLDFNNINNSATPSMEEIDFHWFPYLKRKIKY